MQLNMKKLEARIQKLHEIKRIAADPELVAMLLEFLVSDDDRTDAPQAAKPVSVGVPPSQEHIDIVEQVLKGKDAQGNVPWAARRA